MISMDRVLYRGSLITEVDLVIPVSIVISVHVTEPYSAWC